MGPLLGGVGWKETIWCWGSYLGLLQAKHILRPFELYPWISWIVVSRGSNSESPPWRRRGWSPPELHPPAPAHLWPSSPTTLGHTAPLSLPMFCTNFFEMLSHGCPLQPWGCHRFCSLYPEDSLTACYSSAALSLAFLQEPSSLLPASGSLHFRCKIRIKNQ